MTMPADNLELTATHNFHRIWATAVLEIKGSMPYGKFITDMTPYNIEEMYKDLLALIDTVKDPNLNGILRAFFVEDADFIKAFKKSSAAKAMHHSFIGGLLQHTLSVAQISDYVAGHYSIINRDLLVTAAICHDIGKVNELSSFPENDYTDVGN